jgi:hypothetical protein
VSAAEEERWRVERKAQPKKRKHKLGNTPRVHRLTGTTRETVAGGGGAGRRRGLGRIPEGIQIRIWFSNSNGF